jgi:hypothetical protein
LERKGRERERERENEEEEVEKERYVLIVGKEWKEGRGYRERGRR